MGTGSRNLAARAGRWSAQHWKTATVVWLLVVVAAVGIGRTVGTVKLRDSEQATGEAARTQAILADAGTWLSPELTSTQSWRLVATKKGRFTYHCSAHPGMKATLIVE